MKKKTFIFYKDWEDYTEEMSLEEKGQLFQCILEYQNGKDVKIGGALKFVWNRIKKQMDMDMKKWEEEIEKRREAGRLGGLSKASKGKQKLASASKGKQELADNVNVNVNENVNVNDNNNLSKDKEQSSILNLQQEKKKYGNPEINKIIDIIKKYNNGLCKGSKTEQRRFGKHLYNQLKNITKDNFDPFDTLEFMIQKAEKNSFYATKTTGPKDIYNYFTEIVKFIKHKDNNNKSEVVDF